MENEKGTWGKLIAVIQGWVGKHCDMENLSLVVGAALLARGVYLWWPPGAWMVLGIVLLLVWVMLCVAAFRRDRRHDGNSQ